MLSRPTLLVLKNDQDQGHERGSCLELTRKTSCEERYGHRPRTEHRSRARAGKLRSELWPRVRGRFCSSLDCWPLWRSESPRWWALVIAAAFAIVALIRPQVLHHLNRAWLAFGKLLHRIVSPIVMSALFFLCVTPTAWIMRMRGKDLLSLKRRPDLKSYWIDREPIASRSSIDETPILSSADGRPRQRKRIVMISIIAELWGFLRVRKKFWLVPILLMLLIFGGLIILVQGSAVAPFIYTLF